MESLNRPRVEIPIVIRKDGKRLIAEFPVEMCKGDQLIVARVICGWTAPEEVVLAGFTDNGPVIHGSTEDEFLKTTNPLKRMGF